MLPSMSIVMLWDTDLMRPWLLLNVSFDHTTDKAGTSFL